jgi:TolB-like protein/DNA-binding winged helix-turn-helix (wHTH) protein
MSSENFRFEDFELDRAAYQLRRAGQAVHLERIPLELLFLLVERRGQLLTRQEILERIWGKEVFVDVDNSINTAVRKIRQALTDNPDAPRFLYTVPGKGYRFVAPIVEALPIVELASGDSAVQPPAAPLAVSSAARKSRFWMFWLALAVMLVMAVLVTSPFLRRTTRPTPAKVTLVVLPFENMSGDAGQDYFADGMTEEMITQLGSLDPQHLGVIARTSAMQYKGARKDAAQIGKELGVSYLLEGSIRRAGDRVRVTAQLIQTNDQTHIWADSFDRDVSDVLKLQSEVARAIAARTQLTLSRQAEARLAATLSVNPEAHEAYLRGLEAWNLRSREGFTRSIAEFNRAVALDSNYALAYAALARAYSLAPVSGGASAAETMPKARDAATRALAIDDTLAEGHTILAFVKAHFDFDWPGAQREYRRGLELNPSYAYGHLFYSNSYLSPFGRHDEAIAEMKKAIDLDPFSSPIQSFLGRTFLWARRYDEALAQFQKSIQIFADFPLDHERLAHLYTYTGKFEDAIAEDSRARLLSGEDPQAVAAKENALKQAFTTGGPHGYWEKLLEFSQSPANPPEAYNNAWGRAILYTRLGDKERAFESLEKAYAERQLPMTELGIEPAFDLLRSDPRFENLLRRVGLVQ